MGLRALTLHVDADGAQALSDALLEAGAQSVSVDEPDSPRPMLHVLVDLDRDAAQVLGAAARAAGLTSTPAFAATEVADEDWVRRTQAQFQPAVIGQRLWVGPTWHEAPAGRVAVRLDPGLAFGTGSHPTTRLVLGYLEERIVGGEHVLDYGCGSGILAIVAVKLGAARADAVDIDPQAVQTANENARANGIALHATLPDGLPDGRYDMVVSNILAQPLIVLAPFLASRTRPHGRMALSGILESQASEVAAAYEPWFETKAHAVDEGWALVSGHRR